MLHTWQSPGSAIRWFRRFRWAALPVLGLGAIWEHVNHPNCSLVPIVWMFVGALVVEALDQAWTRRFGYSDATVSAHVVVTLAELGVASWVLRAGDHPGLDMLVQFVIPCALALTTRQAWAASITLVLLHNGVVLYGPRLAEESPVMVELMQSRRLQQMIAFDLSVLALTATVGYVRNLLVEREVRLQEALDDRARDQRLVSLGVLAAGLAHELGTPLSSIDLLAREAQSYPEEAVPALFTLREQVQRCREILDRVRGTTARTVSLEVESIGPAIRGWVADWQAAGLDRGGLRVSVPEEVDSFGVSGDPDTWRGIIWSLLDNAARAGAPISIHAEPAAAGGVVVEIDDSGAGPSGETVARAGQAFFTSWPDGGPEGRGLALFVATTFARRWGGEIRLARRSGGGGRVTVRLATIPRQAG